jgi:hypothetical protein
VGKGLFIYPAKSTKELKMKRKIANVCAVLAGVLFMSITVLSKTGEQPPLPLPMFRADIRVAL